MSEYLSACLASLGNHSPSWMPSTLVGRQFLHRAHVVVARVRLRVPGVVVRHAAPQEDLDDRLGLDGAGRRRDGAGGLRRWRGVGAKHAAVVEQQSGRAEEADAQDFAPGHRQAERHHENVCPWVLLIETRFRVHRTLMRGSHKGRIACSPSPRPSPLGLSIAHIYLWPYIIISLYHSHLCILWWDA